MHQGGFRSVCGVLAASILPACADPCADDGLIQSDREECPADAAASLSGSDSTTDGSEGGSETAAASANSASASGSTANSDSDSDSDASATTTPRPPTSYCTDGDMDGFGDPADCVEVPDGENPPEQTVPNGEDCDDADANTFPGAAELESDTACMQDDDEDGWGDDTPGPGVTAGSDCSDDGVDPCVVLVTEDGTDGNPYDQDLIAVLQGEGFEIFNFAAADVTLEDANGDDLAVISETALSTTIAGVLRETPAPVVCLEGLIWDDMSMAAEPTSSTDDTVEVVDDASNLAGGLSGTVVVVAGAGSGLFQTAPPAGAEVVLTLPAAPASVVGFAFEEGVTMQDSFVSPARRVGLGYDADQLAVPMALLTPDGSTLFQAAVRWATSG